MRPTVSILALVSFGSRWASVHARLDCLLGVLGEVAAELRLLGPDATQFCSSFITNPATKTATRTLTGTSVVTVTVPTTTTISDPGCAATGGPVVPREKRNLDHFASQAISSACSCLHLAPTVTTTLTIGPATTTTQVTVPVATSTICVGPSCVALGGDCTQYQSDSACCGGQCFCGDGAYECTCL